MTFHRPISSVRMAPYNKEESFVVCTPSPTVPNDIVVPCPCIAKRPPSEILSHQRDIVIAGAPFLRLEFPTRQDEHDDSCVRIQPKKLPSHYLTMMAFGHSSEAMGLSLDCMSNHVFRPIDLDEHSSETRYAQSKKSDPTCGSPFFLPMNTLRTQVIDEEEIGMTPDEIVLHAPTLPT